MANDYAWLRYGELQQRSRKVQKLSDYAWGIESALNFLLDALKTDRVPANPEDLDAALSRVIASGARLHRSHSAARKKWVLPSEMVTTHTAAEANIELARIGGALRPSDADILQDAGLGYNDREIADRHVSTPGAIRTRLSRLRLKLTTHSRSESHRPVGVMARAMTSRALLSHPQPRGRAA